MTTSDEDMLVVRSIRQAFEMYASNGGAVQAHQNPFFISVNGEFDLLKTAGLVLKNLDQHRAYKAKILEDERAAFIARVAKEQAAVVQREI